MEKTVSNFLSRSSGEEEDVDVQYLSTSTNKKIRLFGFELDPHKNGKGLDRRDESPDSLSTSISSEKDKSPLMAESKETKKFKCQYCRKGFANSQALGGHQNAHRRERSEKRKILLEARNASLYSCYFKSYDQITDDDDLGIQISFDLYEGDLLSFKDPYSCGYRHTSGRRMISSLSDDEHANHSFKYLDLELALSSYSSM